MLINEYFQIAVVLKKLIASGCAALGLNNQRHPPVVDYLPCYS